ncbi:hypothetical protein ACFQEU_10730, partial [Halorubrum tibetense]
MSDATPESTRSDGATVPEIDLPSDAVDDVLAAVAALDPGEPLRFEGFSVGHDGEGEYVLAAGER